MWHKLYRYFIVPRSKEEDTANREFVLNVLLAGAAVTMLAAFIALTYRYVVVGATSNLPTMISVLVMLAVVCTVYQVSRRGRHKLAGFLFVLLYFLIAVGASLTWGLTMPANVSLFSLIIVLCGILIGARYSIYGFVAVVLTCIVLRIMQTSDAYHPDFEWTVDPSGVDELMGVCLSLGVIAIVSWLFNFRMERSLRRAERAEAALKRQKAQLEKTVEKRTRELQEAQLEKVQELYKFAELGQLSTALMHELANHLTTLTLDIESLEAENRSRMLQRAKRSMHYIDKMVVQVRDQLRGKTRARPFNVVTETSAVINMLQHKAGQAGVRLLWDESSTSPLRARGDTVRFRQLLTNVVSNAIDAYDRSAAKTNKQVKISLALKRGFVTITIEDWGKGIVSEERAKLFEPFHGSKKGGLGLGLFIARQLAQDHFGGNVTLGNAREHTTFVITLKAYEPDR